MKKKVLVISGTRAEFSLLESSFAAMGKSKKLEPLLLVTGMHTLKKFGNTIELVRKKVNVSAVVPVSQNGDMLSWLSEEIAGIAQYCKKNTPDCILLLGDRDEPLAAALVGAHLGIPIAHIHGGDLSGDSVTDTKNRNVITQYSTFHFPATETSARRIKKIIGDTKNVYVVGSPGIDLIKKHKRKSKDTVAKEFNLDFSKKWALVLMHPCWINEISFEMQIGQLIDALKGFDGEIIWIYPNSDEGSSVFIENIEKFSKSNKCIVFKNLPREDYINIMANADVMVGNSSSGIIESIYFHLPAVNIGDRQKGRERSTNVIDCNYSAGEIIEAIRKALSPIFRMASKKSKQIYGNGLAGEKIVELLEHNL